jgi:hypothetical protein
MITDEIPLRDLLRVYCERVETGLDVKVMPAIGC